jgi:hypothetical protein
MGRRKIQITDETQVKLPRTKEQIEAEKSGESPATTLHHRTERIVQLVVTDIYPDPNQPRTPLLPSGEVGGYIRERFIAGEIDCFQAAQEWIDYSTGDLGHTRRIQFFLDMAAGFAAEDGGQINPVTVVPMEEPKGAFLIETGEQRYWATVLGYVKDGQQGDPPMLKVVVKQEFSRKRQVLENRHVGPPTAVSQAREIATLFLSEGFIELPDELAEANPAEQDPFAIHRWVANERKPHKSWEALEEIMSMSDRAMRRILACLNLPTDLLFLADRFDLPERVLREIIAQPEDLWAELIDLAINEGWTGADLQTAEIIDGLPPEKPKKKLRPPHQQAHSGINRFLQTLSRTTEERAVVIGQVADEVAGSKDALEAYRYLASLSEQIRLRLFSRGLLGDEE